MPPLGISIARATATDKMIMADEVSVWLIIAREIPGVMAVIVVVALYIRTNNNLTDKFLLQLNESREQFGAMLDQVSKVNGESIRVVRALQSQSTINTEKLEQVQADLSRIADAFQSMKLELAKV